ncbi:MAG: hypothetical protein NTV51_23765 [Verrucomicrobia bacterium]|nr:hypothetical protein [Verrucomicrobiota bacterium]
MILTREGRRTWWLVMLGVWGIAALLTVLDAVAFREYIDLLDRAGPRVPPISTPMQHIVPTNYADAQTWVRYALTFDEGGPARVRFTLNDNAPDGREVHWSSGFAHLIALAGRWRAVATGEPLPLATERVLPWFNLPLLLGVVVLFSAWTARRAGAGAGAFVALALVGTNTFYGGFGPMYVDHHGVLSAATFGVALGAMFMGGGWWRAKVPGAGGLLPNSRAAARSAAIFSAVCGAVGMGFSAASTIPVIGFTGLAGLLAGGLFGKSAQRDGAEFDEGLWRLWGRVGAVGSLFFYLLEYAPDHVGLRMEVNHPFYALAWWGGGELVAVVLGWRLAPAGTPRPPLWRFGWPLLAGAVAPLTILLGGTRVFLVGDPFVAGIPQSVAEGLSLVAIKKAFGWPMFFYYINWNVAPFLIAAALLFRRSQRDRGLLLFTGLVALGGFVMLIAQVRWALGASGPMLGLLLVTLVALLGQRGAVTRWLAVVGVILVCFVPEAVSRIRIVRSRVADRQPDRGDLQQILYRDAAAAIRASQPKGEIVLLASPNASVAMGYYGNFRTIGTLYWENYAGMRAAAEIFCAPSAEQARERMRRRGITHLALVSEENFLSQYFTILRPGGTREEFQNTFGWQLLYDQRLPLWLRPIPSHAPADVFLPGLRVLLLQVVPDQTEADALWHIALAQLAVGEAAVATGSFEAAVMRAPESRRVQLCLSAGNICYANGAHASAVRLYRAVLTAGENHVASGNLAWILATTTDDRLRNGADALAVAQKLPADDPTSLSALAAALAESGRFPEAVAAAARALDLAKAAGSQNPDKVYAARLEAYRAGRPWRQ